MATEFLAAAFQVQLASVEKFVLIALADTANDEGLAWPSVRFLTLKTGLSDRAVRGAFGSLEVLGYLVREHRANSSTRYWLNLPALLAGKNPAWPEPKSYPQPPARGAVPPARGAVPPARGAVPPARGADRSVSYPGLNPSNNLRRSDALKRASPESGPELPPEVRAANLAKLRALVGLPSGQ